MVNGASHFVPSFQRDALRDRLRTMVVDRRFHPQPNTSVLVHAPSKLAEAPSPTGLCPARHGGA